MSTRQSRNSRLGYFIIPTMSALLIAYFSYHAWSGRYGIEAMKRLEIDAARLEAQLVQVSGQRQALEKKVQLLRDGTIERDMLDEQARNGLNMLHENEIAVLR